MRHTVNTPIDARPEGSTLATPVRRVILVGAAQASFTQFSRQSRISISTCGKTKKSRLRDAI